MPDPRSRLTDEELGVDLTGLGAELDYPVPGDLAAGVRRRLEAESGRPGRGWRGLMGRRGPWLWPRGGPAWRPIAAAVAFVVVLFAASLAAFPGVRETVADWLGLRGIGISVVPSLAPVSSAHRGLELGVPVRLDDARTTVRWRIIVPEDTLLGPPDEVYLDARAGDQVVSLVWAARPGLPSASMTGAGLLLTEFRASIDERFFQKFVGPGTALERVRVGGRLGYWISGAPHEIILVDRFGEPIVETVRLAGNVLLWEDGELTLRIESALPREEAVRIAESVR